MHYVLDTWYADWFKLRIRFENEQFRVVDLLGHLDGPVFEPLKDLPYFRQFTVNRDIDMVVWPNDADFFPDFLFEIGKPVSEQPHPADATRQRG